MATIARDLPTGDRPFQVAPPEFEFPFLKNGDSVSFLLTRFWKQTIAGYNADRLAARYVPGIDADAEYPAAYMTAESKPVRTRTGMCEFQRTYARIPAQQTVPSFLQISLPLPPAPARPTLEFNNPTLLTGDAFYYGGRIFASGSLFGALKTISAEATSGSDKRLTINSHGFTTSKPIAIIYTTDINDLEKNVSVFPYGTSATGQWSVVDANTIELKGLGGTTNYTAYSAGGWARDYKPGALATVRTQRVTDFYLPGVTAGVATMNDVPLPTFEGDDASFVSAVISGTTTLNYEVGELSQWRDSPILARTLTTINPSSL